MRTQPLIMRMSGDIALFLGAKPLRGAVNPDTEIFIWSWEGLKLVWPLAASGPGMFDG